MNEIKRIEKNNQLEIPDGEYDIIRVKNISNPKRELDIFKKTITVFLKNKNLSETDSKWNELLPPSIVEFTKQLVKDDFHKDELLSNIPSMIDGMKDEDLKKWEWYSSKLNDDGFEVIMSGIFRGTFLPLLHHQGVPHKSLFIERAGVEYPTKALTDVLTYRTWNPETLELR